MSSLRERFDAHLTSLGLGGPALVAVSGGPDSVALLDLLVHAPSARSLALSVVHVDHGIHPASGAVAERVAALAAGFRLACRTERVTLGPGASETRAREARLAGFARARRAAGADLVFTGHHADDQAETVLMRVCRGSGPAGLGGIAPRQGPYVRPLLPFTRDELARHASEQGHWVWDDPANTDLAHDRSWLRQLVLPILGARYPGLRWNLSRLASSHREERTAWEELLEHVAELEYRVEPRGGSVAAHPLTGYSSSLSGAVVRALGRRVGVRLGARHVRAVQRLVEKAHTGRSLELVEGAAAEVTFGRLRLFRVPEHLHVEPIGIPAPEGRAEFAEWTIGWRADTAPSRLGRQSTTTWVVPSARYRFRVWAPGDRLRPLGGRGSRLVVRCMQDRKIPKSDRRTWPVLEHDGVVVWVPDVCRADALVPAPGAPATRIDARRN